MSGIVCASDSDYTIYQLSKKLPLAVAVNSHSPIPWDSIISAYIRKGESVCKLNVEEYAQDFIRQIPAMAGKSWDGLSNEDRNNIFMGYGKDDLFPCVYEVVLSLNEAKGEVEICNKLVTHISHRNPASINFLGNLDSVYAILQPFPAKLI